MGFRSRLWAIARAEGRRLARHPLTVAGLLLSVVLTYLSTRHVLPVLVRDTVLLTATAAPLAVTTFVAAHLATTRPSRDHTDTLFGAYPLKPQVRTLGLLIACLWPAAVGLLLATAGVLYLYAVGGIGWPNLFDVLAVPAAVTAAGVIGVAVGRWIPSPIAAALGAVMLVATHLVLAGNTIIGAGGSHLSRLMLTGDWGAGLSVAPELLPRAPGVHLAYVAGVVATFAGTAVARHRPRLLAAGLAVTGVAVVGATAHVLLQPVTGERADELFELMTDPSDSLACETRDAVEYCVLPRYTPWIDRWHGTISGVFAAYPAEQQPNRLRVEMSLQNSWSLEQVIPSHAAQLWDNEQQNHGRNPDVIYVSTVQKRGAAGDVQDFTFAVTINKVLLDIGGMVRVDNPDSGQPYDPAFSDGPPAAELEVPCTTAGQAREVVALYLAGQASPAAERGLRHLLAERSYGFVPWASGTMAWADQLHIHPSFDVARATSWSLAGATYARALLDRPDEQVLGQMQDEWHQWTDPSSSRQQLLDAFGLEALPTLEQAAEEQGMSRPDQVILDVVAGPNQPSAPCQ